VTASTKELAATQNDAVSRSSPVWGMVCLALLLLAPLCVSRCVEKPFSVGLPVIDTGDEPHYLVLINSLISDGDFDLANNYREVHRGGLQAGRKFAGEVLEHHVNWYRNDQLVKWWQAFEMDAERWNKDSEGHPVPTPNGDSNRRPVSEKEYSQHSVGLAVVLAPFLLAFRGTSLVEPAALFCSGMATVGGCCAWCWLVKRYTNATSHLLAAAVVAYLGSPLWHYGLVLYTESFLAFFAVAAFAFALRANNYAIAGLFLGAGVLLKAPFGLVALPLIGDALVRRRWRQALECALPVACAILLVMYWNQQMYGGWLRNPQVWEPGSIQAGAAGLAFSWERGLFWVSPTLCLLPLVLPEWFRNHPRDAVMMTLAIVLYGGLMASWAQWWGGTCYSSRLIVPIIPFLYAPVALLFDSYLWTYRVARWASIALFTISIAFGTIAAFGCNYVAFKHPLDLFL
jgi:hypothetical protein